MPGWQYAQLTVTVDEHQVTGDTRTVRWHGPGHDAQDSCAGDQSIVELLNGLGADGWELTAIQDHRGGGSRSFAYRDPLCALATYTFKRPAGEDANAAPRRLARAASKAGSGRAQRDIRPIHTAVNAGGSTDRAGRGGCHLVTAVRRDGAAEGGRLDRVVRIGLGTPQPFPASGRRDRQTNPLPRPADGRAGDSSSRRNGLRSDAGVGTVFVRGELDGKLLWTSMRPFPAKQLHALGRPAPCRHGAWPWRPAS